MRKKKDYKRCPRCDRKVPLHQPKCQHCGLIFARLSKATNDAAKKALRKKEYNKVIYDSVLPRDMNKWKFFFLTLFLGWCGGHQYYIGKTGKGITASVTFAMIFASIWLPTWWWNDFYLSSVLIILILPFSFTAIFWIVAIFGILFNKYKVPIAIDEELVLAEDYDEKLVKDVLKSVGKDEKPEEKKNLSKKELKKLKAEARKERARLEEEKLAKQLEEEKSKEKKTKPKMIKVVCKNCGRTVKIEEGETICPNCEDNINGED